MRRAQSSREWIATNAARERDIERRPARPSGGPFPLSPFTRRALAAELPAKVLREVSR
jgi:hypothetical protein